MVMPLGLCNAPAIFQAYINQALKGYVDLFCIVYLDDILVFSENRKQHARHLWFVLNRLRKYKLYANQAKCRFFTTKMKFLGFIVGTDRVSMNSSQIKTVTQWPEPMFYRKVQVFLGFANF